MPQLVSGRVAPWLLGITHINTRTRTHTHTLIHSNSPYLGPVQSTPYNKVLLLVSLLTREPAVRLSLSR